MEFLKILGILFLGRTILVILSAYYRYLKIGRVLGSKYLLQSIIKLIPNSIENVEVGNFLLNPDFDKELNEKYNIGNKYRIINILPEPKKKKNVNSLFHILFQQWGDSYIIDKKECYELHLWMYGEMVVNTINKDLNANDVLKICNQINTRLDNNIQDLHKSLFIIPWH